MQTLKKYLLPGLVFQSVVIAGGYGTGRELAEFFLRYGPAGGLLAMLLVSMVIWSAVNAVSFEFARVFRCHDYRVFFHELLGGGWILFEICYVILLVFVLAIIASAAGEILLQLFALPYWFGVAGIMGAVGFLVFRGSETIEKFLTGWSVLLYGVYVAFFVLAFRKFGPEIADAFRAHPVQPGWFQGGVEYAGYNLAVIPAVLFTIRHLETRRQAIGAGLLAGPIGMIPAVLFFTVMASQYPAIQSAEVPANYLLDLLGSRVFQITFQFVLFGTLIETGTGLIHSVNERISTVFSERGQPMPPLIRPAIALGLLLVGTGLAQFGIVPLIGKGYGTLTFAFLAIYVIPVLTWGVWKIRQGPRSPGESGAGASA